MEDKKPLKERLTPEEYDYLGKLCLESARSLGKLEEQIAKEREQELATEELIKQAKLANSWSEQLKNGVVVTPNKVKKKDD